MHIKCIYILRTTCILMLLIEKSFHHSGCTPCDNCQWQPFRRSFCSLNEFVHYTDALILKRCIPMSEGWEVPKTFIPEIPQNALKRFIPMSEGREERALNTEEGTTRSYLTRTTTFYSDTRLYLSPRLIFFESRGKCACVRACLIKKKQVDG